MCRVPAKQTIPNYRPLSDDLVPGAITEPLKLSWSFRKVNESNRRLKHRSEYLTIAMASASNRVSYAQSGVSKKKRAMLDVEGGQSRPDKDHTDDRETLESLSPGHSGGLCFLAEQHTLKLKCGFVMERVYIRHF